MTTGNDLAVLGNGPHGIDLFDIGSGVRPIKLSSFDTPGSVRKANMSGGLLVIADADAGLTVLDISNPETPSIKWRFPQSSSANAVTSIGNIAFVGLEDGSVKSYDLVSGQPIDSISFDGIIEDLGFGLKKPCMCSKMPKPMARVEAGGVASIQYPLPMGAFRMKTVPSCPVIRWTLPELGSGDWVTVSGVAFLWVMSLPMSRILWASIEST